MKHERNIRPERKQNWRREKTLSRRLDARPLEKEDLKYIGVAYRKGALASMGDAFRSGDMDSADFIAKFMAEIDTNYHGAWTLFAETKNGFIPIGLVLGFWSHPNPQLAPFMIVGDMIWFPWASSRNRVEAGVFFFNRIRHEIPMVEYANEDAKPYFEMLARHGIVRRVGTSFNVYPGQATAVFETRV